MTEHQRSASNAGHSIRGLFQHVRYEHLVAGVSGGVSATLALHPLDVIKVRLQGTVDKYIYDKVAFTFGQQTLLVQHSNNKH